MTDSRGMTFWLRQIWRDEAIRSLPIWIVVTALNTSAATGALVFDAVNRSTDPSSAVLLVVLWLALGVYLVACRGRARASRLDLTLPLASRQLWLSHLGATVLAGLVTLAVSVGVVAAQESLLDMSLGWQRLVGPLVGGLVLLAVVMQSYERDLREPPRGRFNLLLVATLAVVLLMLLALIRWPAVAVLAPVLLAAAIGYRTWSALAGAFTLVPATAAEASRRAEQVSAGLGEGKRRRSAWTLFSILHHAPPWGGATPWVLYVFVVAIGFVMAGGLNLFIDDQILRVMYLPLASYGLFTGIGVLVYQGFRLDPLPVRRARLFALLLLPTLAVFLVGFAGARVGLSATGPSHLVGYNIRGEHYWVGVPVHYLSVGRDSEVPVIEAPWGESHPAWREPLFKRSDRVLWSPFSTSEKSSARFEAFLVSRAVEAIYGRVIPPDEILARYFEVEHDRPVGFKRGGFSLLDDYPDLVAPSAGPETPVYLALVVVPWFLAVAVFFRAFRAPSSERRLKRTYWAIMFLLLAAMLGQVAGMATRLFNAEAPSALLGLLIRQLGATPLSVALTWSGAIGVVVGAYLLALAQFRRAEMPASPIRLSLIDFAPGDC